jgi:OOP family OmpA-OmpF porin
VTARLAAMPQGMTLARQQITPPIVRPYTFAAEKTEQGVTLSGHVPSAQARGVVIAAANTLGRPVTDRMQIADGAPASYANNVDFALARLGQLATGQASLTDTSLTITGRAATMPNFTDVRARLASLPQGLTLSRQEIAPPVVRPFNFEVEKSASGVVLTGFVPNEAARAAIVAAAQQAGSPVTDRLQVADGAPVGDFAGAGRALLGELARLQTGKAMLIDTQATITGLGQSGVTEDAVRGALRQLPQGFQLARAQIEPGLIRPYLFNVTRGDNALTLSGHVPDQAARTALVDHARRFFEGDRVNDTLQIGPGAPQGFLNAARSGMQDLSRLLPGSSFAMSDQSVALRGLATHDGARDQILGEFRQRIPQGFGSMAEINTAPPPPAISALPECQILFNDLLSRGRILFNTGSAELAPESVGLLDRLVVVARRCNDAKLEVSGHTDADGAVAMNNDLSRRRAESVAQYLARAGISAERLEPVGYGPSRPVAPNDSAENKAKNRRIEFTVK